jgi:membrane protease YdiL (CAAX protease family)
MTAIRSAWAEADGFRSDARAPSDAVFTAILCVGGVVVAVARGLAEMTPPGGLDAGLWWALAVAAAFSAPALFAGAIGEDARSLGLGLGHLRRDAPIYAVALAICIPFVLKGTGDAANQAYYPASALARDGGIGLAVWLLAYGAQFVALEILFRGWLLVPLARRVGALAVPLGVVPYVMLHFVWDKPVPEALVAIPFALFMGVMALRSRSIWGCALVHMACAFTMDVGVLWRTGVL